MPAARFRTRISLISGARTPGRDHGDKIIDSDDAVVGGVARIGAERIPAQDYLHQVVDVDIAIAAGLWPDVSGTRLTGSPASPSQVCSATGRQEVSAGEQIVANDLQSPSQGAATVV